MFLYLQPIRVIQRVLGILTIINTETCCIATFMGEPKQRKIYFISKQV